MDGRSTDNVWLPRRQVAPHTAPFSQTVAVDRSSGSGMASYTWTPLIVPAGSGFVTRMVYVTVSPNAYVGWAWPALPAAVFTIWAGPCGVPSSVPGALSPTELVAVTSKQYVVPFVRPVTGAL